MQQTQLRPLVFCILLSIPLGAFELSLGGKTPKFFFTTLFSFGLVITEFLRINVRKSASDSYQGEFGRQRKVLTRLTLAYSVLLVISLVQYIDLPRSLYIVVCRVVTLICFVLVINYSQRADHRGKVLAAASIVGAVIAAMYFGGSYQVYDTSSLQGFASDVAKKDNLASVGFVGVSNTIASFMAFTIPLTLAFGFLPRKSMKLRLLCLISFSFQIIALIMTASRGGVGALVFAILLALPLCFYKLNRPGVSFRWVSGILLFVLAGYIFFLLTPDPIVGRYQEGFSGRQLAIGHAGRLDLDMTAGRAFLSNPLLGIGIGNFGFYDQAYGTGAGSETHNLFMQTLAEEGIFSFLILCSILLILGRRLLFLARTNYNSSHLWVFTAFLACLFNANIEPTFWVPQFTPLFWICTAILVSGPVPAAGVQKQPIGFNRELPQRFR